MVRTITVTDEAYAALAALKQSRRDSFSKVILRLTKGRGDPVAVAGGWEDMSEEEALAFVESSRQAFQGIGGGG